MSRTLARAAFAAILILAAAVGFHAPAAAAAAKKTPPKKTASKTVKKKAAPVKSSKSTASSSKKKAPVRSAKGKRPSSRQRNRARVRARSFRAGQQKPDSARYLEIEQALASRGFLTKDPDGSWGAESEDALRRFQSAENLRADGKISSLSLIALGLGPSSGASPAPAAPGTQPPAAPGQ